MFFQFESRDNNKNVLWENRIKIFLKYEEIKNVLIKTLNEV